VIRLRDRASAGRRVKPRFWRMGELIRRARLVKGISTSEAAKYAGLSAGHWWRIESGYSMPKGDTLSRVAQALGLNPEDLVAAAEQSQQDTEQRAEQPQLDTAQTTVQRQDQDFVRYYLCLPEHDRGYIRALGFMLGPMNAEQKKRAVAMLVNHYAGATD
jgi:transcriptional regulator with XRE-family HTH domain